MLTNGEYASLARWKHESIESLAISETKIDILAFGISSNIFFVLTNNARIAPQARKRCGFLTSKVVALFIFFYKLITCSAFACSCYELFFPYHTMGSSHFVCAFFRGDFIVNEWVCDACTPYLYQSTKGKCSIFFALLFLFVHTNLALPF